MLTFLCHFYYIFDFFFFFEILTLAFVELKNSKYNMTKLWIKWQRMVNRVSYVGQINKIICKK